jgi:L-rhamnose isomerase
MLDQCHTIEPQIPAQSRSVLNVQQMIALTLIVDGAELETAQSSAIDLQTNPT